MVFRTPLYRYFFFGWLFHDVTRGNLFERGGREDIDERRPMKDPDAGRGPRSFPQIHGPAPAGSAGRNRSEPRQGWQGGSRPCW